MSVVYQLRWPGTPPHVRFVNKGPRWSVYEKRGEVTFLHHSDNPAPPPSVAPPTVPPENNFGTLIGAIKLDLAALDDRSRGDIAEVKFLIDQANIAFAALDQNVARMNFFISEAHGEIAVVRDEATTLFSDITAHGVLIDGLTSHIDNVDASVGTFISAQTSLNNSFAGQVTDINASLGVINARITDEIGSRVTETEALSARVIALSSNLDGLISQISIESFTRSTLTDSLASTITTLTTTVASYTSTVTSESIARSTADSALASRIDNIVAVTGGATAAIDAEASARVTADEALAVTINSLAAVVSGNSAAITTEQSVRATADLAEANARTVMQSTLQNSITGTQALITTEAATRASADAALAATATSLQAQINNNVANITNESIVRATQDSVLATSIQSVTTTLNGHTANIQQIFTSVNGLSASWGLQVSLDNVSGAMYFYGVRQAGGGAVFNLEIFAGLIVHGDVVIDGTIKTPKIGPNAVSNSAGSSGTGGQASVTLTLQANAFVSIYGGFFGHASTPYPASGQLRISVNGLILSMAILPNIFQQFLPTPASVTWTVPAAGTYNFVIQAYDAAAALVADAVGITVIQLVR